jgi:hypothetical protein
MAEPIRTSATRFDTVPSRSINVANHSSNAAAAKAASTRADARSAAIPHGRAARLTVNRAAEPTQKPLAAITARYHSALSFGVRRCVR